MNLFNIKNSITTIEDKSLNAIIAFSGEMISGHGEDSYSYFITEKSGFMGVFDGCGGLGARKYEKINNFSGAYISSRVIADSLVNLFENNLDLLSIDKSVLESTSKEIYRSIYTNLQDLNSRFSNPVSIVRGSLTKDLPTTLAMVLFENTQKILKGSFFWVGDSRGYILTSSGIKQCTKDNVDSNEDELSNLSNDSRLENVISSDGNFKIFTKYFESNYPAILICATDGCFNYFCTPMNFEFALLETLHISNSIFEWETLLFQYLKKFACDDYTLTLAAFGWDNFQSIKNDFLVRYNYIKEFYIEQIQQYMEQKNNSAIVSLWNNYKLTYYYKD